MHSCIRSLLLSLFKYFLIKEDNKIGYIFDKIVCTFDIKKNVCCPNIDFALKKKQTMGHINVPDKINNNVTLKKPYISHLLYQGMFTTTISY